MSRKSVYFRFCAAKLHRLTVTGGSLDYVGSITIDSRLLEAAGLTPGEMVQITNLSNAQLWSTYLVPGRKGAGEVILNGPPARLFQKGDKIIVLSTAEVEAGGVRKDMSPTVVFVDEHNRITKVKKGWNLGLSRKRLEK